MLRVACLKAWPFLFRLKSDTELSLRNSLSKGLLLLDSVIEFKVVVCSIIYRTILIQVHLP